MSEDGAWGGGGAGRGGGWEPGIGIGREVEDDGNTQALGTKALGIVPLEPLVELLQPALHGVLRLLRRAVGELDAGQAGALGEGVRGGGGTVGGAVGIGGRGAQGPVVDAGRVRRCGGVAVLSGAALGVRLARERGWGGRRGYGEGLVGGWVGDRGGVRYIEKWLLEGGAVLEAYIIQELYMHVYRSAVRRTRAHSFALCTGVVQDKATAAF